MPVHTSREQAKNRAAKKRLTRAKKMSKSSGHGKRKK